VGDTLGYLGKVGVLLSAPVVGLPAVLHEVLNLDQARTFLQVLATTAPLALGVALALVVMVRSLEWQDGVVPGVLLLGACLLIGNFAGAVAGPDGAEAALSLVDPRKILAALLVQYLFGYGWVLSLQGIIVGAALGWFWHTRLLPREG
jgi:hypothetical protein